MPTYNLEQGDAITWLKARADAIHASEIRPYHGSFFDPPYALEFMGSGSRDAPHKLYAKTHGDEVAGLVRLLGVRPWEAAAILWYRDLFSALIDCLLPGAPVLCCAGERTDDLMACGMRAAGLDVRTKLIYMYGSAAATLGHNLADTMAALGDDRWAGYNTRLKPAYETLIYAMVPIESTYATAAAEWGTVGFNIDACRIPAGGDYHDREGNPEPAVGGLVYNQAARSPRPIRSDPDPGGRWPTTIMLQHSDACDDRGCAVDCPVYILDQQSGVTNSKRSKRGRMVKAPGDSYGGAHAQLGEETNTERGHDDAGTASRFFYTSKVQPWEREAGLDGMPEYAQDRLNSGGLSNEPRFAAKATHNPHPTLKSARALVYLLKLIGRPPHIDSRLVVPCAGTGSEMIAGMLAGWQHVDGVELDADERYPGAFVPIGQARLAWWSQFKTYEEARRAYYGDRRFAKDLAAAEQLGQAAMFS